MYHFTPEQKKKLEKAKRNNKEFLYIGHYISAGGEYVLKIGTTDNLTRRANQHNKYYKTTPNFPMSPDSSFVYDDFIPLSHFSTLKYEETNKNAWKNMDFGTFAHNDRFIFAEKPSKCTIKVKKTYEIAL